MTEPLKIVKYGAVIQVSRAELLDNGLVEPTDAERAEQHAARIEWEQLRRAARDAEAELAAALAPVTDPVARAVLDLHKDDNGICDAEHVDEGYSYSPSWPCQTVLTVASALGVAIPAHLA